MNLANELISKGADINYGDRSPLEVACQLDIPEITKRLVDNGPDINYNKVVAGYTRNPLLAACMYGRLENVEILLGCKRQKLQLNVRDIREVHNVNDTPLIWAVINNNHEIVKLLLDHGADSTFTDDSGRTALYWANMKGHTKIASLLTTHLSQRNVSTPITNSTK